MCGAAAILPAASIGLQGAGMIAGASAQRSAAAQQQAAMDRQTVVSRNEFDRRMAATGESDRRIGDVIRQGFDEQAAFDDRMYGEMRGLDRQVYGEQRGLSRDLFDTTMAAELQAGRDASAANTAAHDARMGAMSDQDRGRAAAWSRIGDILQREDQRRAAHSAATGEIAASTIPLAGTAGFEAARTAAEGNRAGFARTVADAPTGAPVPVSAQMEAELAAARDARVGDMLTRSDAGSRLVSYGDALTAGADALRGMDERLMLENTRFGLGGAGVDNDLAVAGLDRGWADDQAEYRFNLADVGLGGALGRIGLTRESVVNPANAYAGARGAALANYGTATGGAIADFGNNWGGAMGRYWGQRGGAESNYISAMTGASSGYENTLANLTQSKISMTRPDGTLAGILGMMGSVAGAPTTQRWFDKLTGPSTGWPTMAPTYPSRTFDPLGGY